MEKIGCCIFKQFLTLPSIFWHKVDDFLQNRNKKNIHKNNHSFETSKRVQPLGGYFFTAANSGCILPIKERVQLTILTNKKDFWKRSVISRWILPNAELLQFILTIEIKAFIQSFTESCHKLYFTSLLNKGRAFILSNIDHDSKKQMPSFSLKKIGWTNRLSTFFSCSLNII